MIMVTEYETDLENEKEGLTLKKVGGYAALGLGIVAAIGGAISIIPPPPGTTPRPAYLTEIEHSSQGNVIDMGDYQVTLPEGTPMVYSEGYVPDEVLVKFSRDLYKSDSDALIDGLDARIEGEISSLNVQLLRAGDGDAKKLLDALNNSGLVEYAELNYVAHAFDITPNDTYWSLQYGPQRIRAPQAWDLSTGSNSVIIAVLDTGVDLDHPDLAAKIVPGYDFVNRDDNPQDDQGHGTHVAGIAAAVSNNGEGVAGVSWGARIMPVKVLGSNGAGRYSAIVDGIIFATDNGADVINLSLGAPFNSRALEDAVNYAVEHGVTVVTAAGNSGSNTIDYPAAYENTIAVASTDSSDNRSRFSTYGDFVDLAAPGSDIGSTGLDDTYIYNSGTSQAAPHVAGAAAVLIGYSSDFNTPERVRTALETTALDRGSSGWDQYYGHGIIQLDRALQSDPGSAPPPTGTDNPDGVEGEQ